MWHIRQLLSCRVFGELLPWSSRFSFSTCSCLMLGQSPFQTRGFEHWSQGKSSFGLNGQSLWAWQQFPVLGQSQFHSEFLPAKVLAYANFQRAEDLLFPIGHVEQNRKLLCAVNEEAAPLARGHWGAVTGEVALSCHTAGSWSCHFCKAICHLLSSVNSAVLWNEPGSKAKTSFFFLGGLFLIWIILLSHLEHHSGSDGSTVWGKWAMAGGNEKLEQEFLQLVSPPKDVYCTSHLTRSVGIITWRLCSCHFCLNEVVYVWLYNTVLQADPNLFIHLQNRIQEFNLTFNISHLINKQRYCSNCPLKKHFIFGRCLTWLLFSLPPVPIFL